MPFHTDKKTEHTAMGAEGMQMCTRTWPPATVIVPTDSGQILPTISISFSAHPLPTIPKTPLIIWKEKKKKRSIKRLVSDNCMGVS